MVPLAEREAFRDEKSPGVFDVCGPVGCPAGCAAEHGQLTLERVEQLAEKGEALTWSDFEGYAYEEAGSGLYIRIYDVNEEYYVMVGGPSLEESPLYVRLVSRDDGEQYVELREGGLEGFLQGE